MSKPFSRTVTFAAATIFLFGAIPAFANHGGGGGGFHGGGGGGFHGGGGGGFHGGGGSRSSGGGGPRGGSYSPPAAGYRGSYSAPSQRSMGGYAARPGNAYSRPGGNFAGGNQRPGNSYSAPPAVADGGWHSFGGASGSRGASGAQAGTSPSGNSGGFHVFSGNRGAQSASGVRSFSGQGGEIWENSPASRNVVSKAQSLSTIHNSFHGSLAANSGFRSNSMLAPSSRLVGGSGLAGNRGFSGGLGAANSFQSLRGGFNRFGYPYGGFGRGCWNCGFGFGFGFGGWGWGWPWLGFGLWDPFLFDPWWGPGPAYGYGGYYGSPDSYLYWYPDSGAYTPDDNSNPPAQQEYEGSPDGNWVTPNGPSPSSAQNSAALAVPVLIYLKSGRVYTVRDYWMIDGVLHYILMNGMQSAVDLDQVDLPRTNTENARSGVRFIFKSEPSVAPTSPDGNGMPPVQPNSNQPGAGPGSPNAPAPTQQINVGPQPEART